MTERFSRDQGTNPWVFAPDGAGTFPQLEVNM